MGLAIISYLAIAIIIACILLGFIKKLYLTVLLLISNIAVFLLMMYPSGWWEVSPIIIDLGLNPAALAAGWFTPFTSMFLHAGFIHLIFNMLWLITIGLLLEERVNKFGFGLIYFLTGIIGSMVFAISYEFQPAIAVGASGALNGIFGAFVRLYPNERLRLFFFALPAYIWFLIFFGLNFLFTLMQPYFQQLGFIAFASHIGGLVGGFLLAPVLLYLPGNTRTSRKKYYGGLEPLATNNNLKEILERLNSEEDTEIRMTWLEEFARQAKCPKCGGHLKLGRFKMVCEKGDFNVKI